MWAEEKLKKRCGTRHMSKMIDTYETTFQQSNTTTASATINLTNSRQVYVSLRYEISEPGFITNEVEKYRFLLPNKKEQVIVSFTQTIQAFVGNLHVGSAVIEHFYNNPEHDKLFVNNAPVNPDELALRTPNLPTTYLKKMDNFTIGHLKPVKGVGSGLMAEVETIAKNAKAAKLILLPSQSVIKKALLSKEKMADSSIPESEKFKDISYDPTGFYTHLGFVKDPQELSAVTKLYNGMLSTDELLSKVAHLSKTM